MLADAGRGDWVLCQITSSPYGDPTAMPLDAPDFASGGLLVASFARPGKLFTAHAGLMIRSVGVLTAFCIRACAVCGRGGTSTVRGAVMGCASFVETFFHVRMVKANLPLRSHRQALGRRSSEMVQPAVRVAHSSGAADHPADR